MSFQTELLDGFNEALAEFGTTITLEGQPTPLSVLAVGPEVSLEMMMAGYQPKGGFNFQVTRDAAVAAGLVANAKFTAAASPQRYLVHSIEDDPGLPLLFVSAGEVQ